MSSSQSLLRTKPALYDKRTSDESGPGAARAAAARPTEPAIRASGLGKRYAISRGGAPRATTMGEALVNRLRRPLAREKRDAFWALRDVELDIRRGETVGVIGRNGAGKSTLLKVLSRITAPTTGQVELFGRVGSLLEVGTGFHPELTGRENIFLNGQILGMRRAEVARQFDAIVDFAGVEKFLDTPVKRYSSGMYVRLAFAVAAHLEPEILIVDEVLAVGDAAFQAKCLGKMKDVAVAGRTVLFVSHNMAAVRQLCGRAVLMHSGSVAKEGPTGEVVAEYLRGVSVPQGVDRPTSPYGVKLRGVGFRDAELGDEDDGQSSVLFFDKPYRLRVDLHASEPIDNAALVVRFYNDVGDLVSTACTPEEGLAPFALDGAVSVEFDVPPLRLLPGRYTLGVFVYRPNDPVAYLDAADLMGFDVEPSIVRDGMWPYRRDHGVVRITGSAELVAGDDTPLGN